MPAGSVMGHKIVRPIRWAHLDSNQAPTDYESVALTE